MLFVCDHFVFPQLNSLSISTSSSMSVSSNSVPYGPHRPDSVVNESIASSVSSDFVPQEDAEIIGGLPSSDPVFVGSG